VPILASKRQGNVDTVQVPILASKHQGNVDTVQVGYTSVDVEAVTNCLQCCIV